MSPALGFHKTVSVVFDSVLKTMVTIGKENIKAGGLVQKFPPLKRNTINRKKRLGVKASWIDKPLLRFGNLYENIYAKIQGTGTNRELIFGSKVPYAIFHITGTRNMPSRDFTMYNHDVFNKFFIDYIPLISEVAVEETLEYLQQMVGK